MSVNDKIREFALSVVGCAYIYGATGQKCTPSYRKARMEQYPSYANSIKKYCPALKSGSGNCAGCKYNGGKAYDCAQLTRYAAKAAGLELPSGASSQWKKGDWVRKGTIDTLPKNTVCFLYSERESANPMGHTGVYLGDGTVVDARGHSAGVIHAGLDDVKWTHWAMLNGQEFEGTDAAEEQATLQYVVSGAKLALRKLASKSSTCMLRMPAGAIVSGIPVNDEWVKITYNGQVGYSMAMYLQAVAAEEPEDIAEPEDELTDAEKLETLWNWYKNQQ